MRLVHYLNQFFGQVGGEEAADTAILVRAGAVGPARAVAAALGNAGEVVATVIAGDNWVNADLEARAQLICDAVMEHSPDVVLAGPAFGAGRYGVAVGEVVRQLTARGCIAVGAMAPDNPARALYASRGYLVPCDPSVRGMSAALSDMMRLAIALHRGEAVTHDRFAYYPRGRRIMLRHNAPAAERVIALAVAKARGGTYRTEIPRRASLEWVAAPPVASLADTIVVLATDGGVVPCGNPDRIEASMATKWGRYPWEALTCLEISHGGYDRRFAQEDPCRVLPWDGLEHWRAVGVIGGVFPYWYTTAGNATAPSVCEAMAAQILSDIEAIRGQVGVLLTST
ncbi:MAG: glycine/betaine/sarcosine/D-proline family reductase selenoprotein B [Firmicutes bacterium]|nr:glycine/betaine/sarcosine/D-proline family reductase selenoprotein B [Bacillota bacterium]